MGGEGRGCGVCGEGRGCGVCVVERRKCDGL